MTEPAPAPHAWYAGRLVARAAGLLDEAEAAQVAAHVAGCSACRGTEAALLARADREGAEIGHLPADLVAAWPRRAPRLDGLARRLVRTHLERCAACRADLELLGHDPALVGALAPEVPAAPAPRRALAPERSRGLRERLRAFLDPRLGALAGATAVVTVVLLTRLVHAPGPAPAPAGPPALRRPPVASGGAAAPSPVVAAPAFAVEPERPGTALLAFADVTRGVAEPPPLVVPRARAAAGLHVEVPASLLAMDLPESLDVRLESPSGEVLHASRIAARALWPHRMLTLRPGAAGADGVYRLGFEFVLLGRRERREFRFTVRG